MNPNSPNSDETHVSPIAQAGKSQTTVEKMQWLAFVPGSGRCAIGIPGFKETIECDGLTSVPTMPGCVRGVIKSGTGR
jgi:purine-binding chemotaxis protein CheW